jgi:hypothetical protein
MNKIGQIILALVFVIPCLVTAQTRSASIDLSKIRCLQERYTHRAPPHLTWAFLLSEDDCINCNTAVINEIVDQIQSIVRDTDIVVVVNDASDATIKALTRRLHTSVMSCPWQDASDSSVERGHTPALIAISRSGQIAREYLAINVNPPDIKSQDSSKINESLQAGQSDDPLVLITRDSNDAVGRIASVQFDSSRGTLLIVDATANVVRRFNAFDGYELAAIEMPDTIRYFYRPKHVDEAWKSLGSLGYDPATFGSIVDVPTMDTFFSLISTLSGYSVEKRALPTNPLDSVPGVRWIKSQILTVWRHDSLFTITDSIASLDASIVNLTRLPNGILLGSCFWPKYLNRGDKVALDSSFMFVKVMPDLHHVRPIVPLSSSSLHELSDEIVPTFIGMLSPIDSNHFAYFNQLNRIFGILTVSDTVNMFHPLPVDSTIRTLFHSESPNKINRANPYGGLPYIVSDIIFTANAVNILLVPNNGTDDARVLRYSMNGTLLGSRTISSACRIERARYIGYYRNKLGLLLFCKKSGWSIRWLSP